MLRLLKILWASPYSLAGLLVGCLGLCTGGRAQLRRGAIEFHGGAVRWLIAHGPLGSSALAMTLGHTILGQTEAALDISRNHEHVHIRQFERWGPLLGPAYLGCSLYIWLRGGQAYRDNPFERQAYDEHGCD